MEVHRLDHFGEGVRHVLRPAGIYATAARHCDQLGADAVPLPLRPERRGVQRGEVRCLERLGQHHGAEHRRTRRVGTVAAPLQPGEQRQVGRREAVPDLLDFIRRDPPAGQFRQRDLGQPGGGADAQAAGDQLQQRVAARGVRRVQPAGDDLRQVGLGGRNQRLDHLGHAGGGLVGGARRPHQGDGVGQVADVIVGPGEQHRVGPRLCQAADQHGFGGLERQFASERGEGETAIRVGFGFEVAAQQGDLGEAARRQHQVLQQLGECDHDGATLARSLAFPAWACFTPRLPCWDAMAASRLCPSWADPAIGTTYAIV